MNKKEKLLIILSSYTLATAILFFIGTFSGYLLVLFSLIYLFVGGKKHV